MHLDGGYAADGLRLTAPCEPDSPLVGLDWPLEDLVALRDRAEVCRVAERAASDLALARLASSGALADTRELLCVDLVATAGRSGVRPRQRQVAAFYDNAEDRIKYLRRGRPSGPSPKCRAPAPSGSHRGPFGSTVYSESAWIWLRETLVRGRDCGATRRARTLSAANDALAFSAQGKRTLRRRLPRALRVSRGRRRRRENAAAASGRRHKVALSRA
jgi:hypothetical protein